MQEGWSWVRRLSQMGTILKTRLSGVKVGEDSFGNVYYRSRFPSAQGVETRWVLYRGEPEPTKVPPVWFAWLHHMADLRLTMPSVCDQPLPNVSSSSYGWQKPHHPNLTGTEAAYLPSGYGLNSMIKGKERKTTPFFSSWHPPRDELIREP